MTLFKDLRTWFKLHKQSIYTWLFGLLFAFQLANVCSYLTLNTYPQAVVASTDDDAAWIVKRAINTRWYKDNGTAVYGPAYFRAVHSLHWFLGDTAAPEGARSPEAWQRTAQFSALLISLFSLAASSLLIASFISSVWSTRLLIASGFSATFMHHPAWVEFLLRAHPDHLFAFVCLLALFCTYKMFAEPHRRMWFVFAAALWGTTVAVKLSTAILAFSFVLLFIPPFTKENFIRGLKFLEFMFLAYFLIGFPQTIVLDRPVRIMLELNAYNQPMTWASVENWLIQIGTQIWRPLVMVILAMALFSDRRKNHPTAKGWLRLVVFCLLPFPLLITKNLVLPMNHYLIPFIVMVTGLVALTGFHIASLRHIPYSLRVAALVAAIIGAGGFIPRTLNSELAKQASCKKESFEAYSKTKELLPTHKFWFDPYFPGDSSDRKSPHKVEWRKTWKDFDSLQITGLGLSRRYYNQYLQGAEQNEWVQRVMPNWKDYRAFYEPFTSGEVATTPSGQKFRRIYENACEQEIWVLETPKEQDPGKRNEKLRQQPGAEAKKPRAPAQPVLKANEPLPTKQEPLQNTPSQEPTVEPVPGTGEGHGGQ